MSWYANTVLPTMETVFANVEPPPNAEAAALELTKAGRQDVANFICRLNPEDYEGVVWDAHLKAIEDDRIEDEGDGEVQ